MDLSTATPDDAVAPLRKALELLARAERLTAAAAEHKRHSHREWEGGLQRVSLVAELRECNEELTVVMDQVLDLYGQARQALGIADGQAD